jgi:hypothetical protein
MPRLPTCPRYSEPTTQKASVKHYCIEKELKQNIQLVSMSACRVVERYRKPDWATTSFPHRLKCPWAIALEIVIGPTTGRANFEVPESRLLALLRRPFAELDAQ